MTKTWVPSDKNVPLKHEGFKGFECHHCQKNFTRQDQLKHHIRAVHEGKKNYNCEECDESFLTKHFLNFHKYEVHGGPKPNTNKGKGETQKVFKCSECSMELKSKRNLLNHVMSVHEGIKSEKRRKNNSAKSKKNNIKSTKNNLDINEELNTAQIINIKEEPLEDLDYKCSICLATFSQKSKLKRHNTLTHKGAKKKINLSKINSDNVSNEIYENQISNEEFLDPNRINIKEEPLDENYDMNTDVFLPDPVKIEPTDENFYDDYDDDPLAS